MNDKAVWGTLRYFPGLRAIELPRTYCHTNSRTCHGEADVIGQGHVNAKHPGVVEELTEDQLTVWGRRGCITDRFHRCDAVGIRNDCANLIWQTETKTMSLNSGFLSSTRWTLLLAVYSRVSQGLSSTVSQDNLTSFLFTFEMGNYN